MAIGFIALGCLIFFSAFFSGMEIAFLSLSQVDLIEIENSHHRNRKILLRLCKERDNLISVILIGNNLANIATSALVTTLAIFYASEMGISEEMSVMISAAILTVTILLFGEIIPKNFAVLHNKSLALFFSPAILFLTYVLRPISFIFYTTSRLFTHLLSGKQKDAFSGITESMVIQVVNKGEELGVINESEKELIKNVFSLDEREVSAIMTPRTSIFSLPDSMTIEEAKDKMLEKMFSRIPVFNESIDNITGIVNLKQALAKLIQGDAKTTLGELSQKPVFVYESMPLDTLMSQFREGKYHLAVVVDEFGGVSGIVTLEDILEELVGDIFDEKDKIVYEIKEITSSRWLVQGKTDLATVSKEIDLNLVESDQDFDSVQGLLMSHLERIPMLGDTIVIGPITLKVVKMDGNEIKLVMMEKTKNNVSPD